MHTVRFYKVASCHGDHGGAAIRVHSARVKGPAPPPPNVVVHFCYSHTTGHRIGTVEAWIQHQHSLSSRKCLVSEIRQDSGLRVLEVFQIFGMFEVPISNIAPIQYLREEGGNKLILQHLRLDRPPVHFQRPDNSLS